MKPRLPPLNLDSIYSLLSFPGGKMADIPELHRNKLREVTPDDFKTEDPLGALAREIMTREKANESKSLLDKTVETFYNVEKGSLDNMKEVGLKAYEASKRGDTAALSAMTPAIRESIDKDRKAVEHQEEVNFYASSFAKAVPLFAGGKGKLLLAASVGVNAAEQVRLNDDLGSGAVHALMGGTKGFAMKKTFDYLGPRSLLGEGSKTAGMSAGLEYANVAAKGVALGGLSRLYETGLTANNYLDAQGKVTGRSISDGLVKTAGSAVNPGAMAMDAVLFMGAHGTFKSLAGAAGRAAETSPLMTSIANSRIGMFTREGQVLTNAGMGATFGLATGSSQEFIRQQTAGEDFNLAKIAKRGALQALTDAAAGATGSSMVHGGRLMQARAAELKATGPKLNRGFAGDEAPLVDADGTATPKEVTPDNTAAKPAVEAELQGKVAPDGDGNVQKPAPETEVQRPATAEDGTAQKTVAEGDGTAPKAVVENDGTAQKPVAEDDGAAQRPVEQNDGTTASTKATYEMTEAQRPVFDEGIQLAQTVLTDGATAKDVLNFLEFGAGRGQEVRAQLGKVAQDVGEQGHTQVQKLIETALNGTPETVAAAKETLRLAEEATKPGVDPLGPEYKSLVEHAWRQATEFDGTQGVVPNAEGAVVDVGSHLSVAQKSLQLVRELTGETPATKLVEEVSAAAGHLEKPVANQKPLDWGDTPAPARDLLRSILQLRPRNAEEHMILREGIKEWADAFPDHHSVLHQYAQITRYGDVTAMIDARLGTDYFSRFRSNQAAEPVADAQPQTARTTEAGDTPSVVHEPGKVTVYPERLIQDFETATGTAKQARAHLLSDHIGSMSDAQFLNWLKYLHSPVDKPGAPPELTNLAAMGMSRSGVLGRPEVKALVTNPETSPLDVSTLRRFLAAPEKAQTNGRLPENVTDHIAYRLETALERQKAANEMLPPEQQKAIDYGQVVTDALPSWYARQLRDTYSTRNAETGLYEYPHDFDTNLMHWLELSRQVEMANPRYRESTPQRNSVADRMSVLEQAMTVRTPQNAKLVDRMLELGGQDQIAVKNMLSKLDPTTNAPEHAEMLSILAPRVENMTDLKTLMDAVNFGKKADQDAFKARKDGRDTSQADKMREANESLAQSVVARILTPGTPEYNRVHQIVSDVISGRIRDPRPETPGGPGGNKGQGGRGQGQDRGGPRRDNNQGR